MNENRYPPRVWRLESAADVVGLPVGRVRSYVRHGLVRPISVQGRTAFFDEPELARLRKLRRLTEDLGINLAGVEIVLRLLDQIEALHAAAQEGDVDDIAALATPRRGRNVRWR